MSNGKSVCIIGGGIAGLSASVFLAESGYKVTLVESSPKLGGRAYSYFDREREMFFDNGQHLFAGWYKDTFEYLKIIKSFDKLDFQKTLEIFFINEEKKRFILKLPDLPAPFNLLSGLLKFKAFGFNDKFGLMKIKSLLSVKINEPADYGNAFDLLVKYGQTENLIKYFWEPFCMAVFNTTLKNIGVRILINILREGFSGSGKSVLVFPSEDLNKVLVNGAVEYLTGKDARIILSEKVISIDAAEKVNGVNNEKGEKIESDYYVSAVPFYGFRNLTGNKIYEEGDYHSDSLRSSGIVSIHLFFRDEINYEEINKNENGMTGLIGTNVQWIFRKSNRHLSLVISGADDAGITEKENQEIYEMAVSDLAKTIAGFKRDEISGYKVIKEKRATFIPDNESEKYRCPQKTRYDNFFICGDWTDTGLPATIESAVRSAKICCNLINEKENS